VEREKSRKREGEEKGGVVGERGGREWRVPVTSISKLVSIQGAVAILIELIGLRERESEREMRKKREQCMLVRIH
jgi:hypothetical protein